MEWCDSSGRLNLTLTRAEAESASHPGPCDEDVEALRRVPRIARQLARWKAEDVRATLRKYGAWEAEELTDDEANLDRMLWLACCDVRERAAERKRR